MNKQGSSMFLTLMLGIVCFVLGLALANPVQETVTESMLNLNCTSNYMFNDTVSNQDKAVCTQMDMFIPLTVGTIFGIAGILVGGMIQ